MSATFRNLVLVVLPLLLVACGSDDPTEPPPESPGHPTGEPTAIADLVVVAATPASITLGWTAPGVPGRAEALAAYELRRAALGGEPFDDGDWTIVATPPPAVPGTAEQVTVGGLAAGSTWVFELRARSADTWSARTGPLVASADPQWDQTPPAPITDLQLRWRSTDELMVTWSATGDDAHYGEAAGYEVRQAGVPLDGPGWDAAAVGPEPEFNPGLRRWTCQLAGLVAGATIHVAVKAVDDVGNWSLLSNPVAAAPPAGNVWHVREDGTGTVPTIAEGIRQAGYRDLILVHPGRYTWTNQGGPMDPLGMIFVGRDTTDFTLASAMGPESTIIDAEDQGCVIFIQGYNDGVVIEGFTITGGANPPSGDPDYPLAGGLTYHLTSPTVRDCIFEGNHGGQGGAVGFFGVGTPTLERCTFRNNHAEIYGGAIYAINVHGPGADTEHGIEILDCVIEGNTAGTSGGGLCFVNAVALVQDCVIAGNTGEASGGGVTIAGRAIDRDADTWVRLERTTLADNSSPLGSAVRVTTTSNGTVTRYGHGRFTSCIVAGHADEPWPSLVDGAVLQVGCSALHDNAGEDALPPGVADLGDDFWLDPLFCGEGSLDRWTVMAASPCLPGAHPDGAECGQVGARGVGCGR
ncbi:MAG: right-handed parallel beta-helix repeat-containing protein [Candidatus Krumholzibacteriia bacterium]